MSNRHYIKQRLFHIIDRPNIWAVDVANGQKSYLAQLTNKIGLEVQQIRNFEILELTLMKKGNLNDGESGFLEANADSQSRHRVTHHKDHDIANRRTGYFLINRI